MDLGIKGRKALLCASSKGLGKACALALSREGVTVWINGRNQSPLDEAAAEIRAKTGGTVHTVKADINTDAGRQAHLAGEIAQALRQVAPELLAKDPDIRPVELVAVK